MWKPIHDPNLRQKLQIWDKSFKFETKGSARLTRFSLSYQFILTSSEVLKTYLIPGYFEGVPHLKLSWRYTSLQVILKAYLISSYPEGIPNLKISSYPEGIPHLKLTWRHTTSHVILKTYHISSYPEGISHLKLYWKHTSYQVILMAYLISSYPESIPHLSNSSFLQCLGSIR